MDPAHLLALRERLRYDTPYWAGGIVRTPSGVPVLPGPDDWDGCMKIVDKERNLVPLIAKPWQLELDDALERQRAAKRPMRAIVLKARKLGFSTWVAAKFLQRLTQIEYQHAIVCAQDTNTASVIFQMALTAWRNLPHSDEVGLPVKPALVAQSFAVQGRKYLAFGSPSKRERDTGAAGESILEIDTAIARDSGRGYTPSMLHLSEVARWSGKESTAKMLGLLNALPQTLETICVLESTANGLNHFHRRWQQAVSGGEDPDTGESYFALFVPWWRDPECAAPFENAAQRDRFIEGIGNTKRFAEVAQDEEELIELYSLTPEQLFWRRRMIREQHESDVELFRQEYPASAEEAFIGSGRTVFSAVLIRKAIEQAEAAQKPVEGALAASAVQERKGRSGTVEVPQGALWVPQAGKSDLKLEVWEHPRRLGEPESSPAPAREFLAPTAQSAPQLLERAAELAHDDQAQATDREGSYVVAVDVAEDDSISFGKELDSHCVQVFDHHSRRQVAVHESRCDLHLLPRFVLLVALYYNRAWLAIEINGPGLAVLEPLAKDYRYPRLYRRRRVDSVRNRTEDRPGWRTDPATKPLLEAALGAALQTEEAGFCDVRTARQLQHYVVDEKGKHGAVSGEHDDRLIAAMIAHRVMDEIRAPLVSGAARKPRWETRDPVTGYGFGA